LVKLEVLLIFEKVISMADETVGYLHFSIKQMNLPGKFIQRMNGILGNEIDPFLLSLEQEIKTSIRVNPAKYEKTAALEKVPYCSTGFFLPSRPLFTLDPFLHSGVYYVQESSSMFLEQALKQSVPDSPTNCPGLYVFP